MTNRFYHVVQVQLRGAERSERFIARNLETHEAALASANANTINKYSADWATLVETTREPWTDGEKSVDLLAYDLIVPSFRTRGKTLAFAKDDTRYRREFAGEVVAMAWEFAEEAHKGQKRRFTDEPYFTHCVGVLSLVREQLDHNGITNEFQRSIAEVPALMHDVLEDTPSTPESLLAAGFQQGSVRIIRELSNHYTKETHPYLNRAQRKNLERARYAAMEGRPVPTLVKLADVCHNLEGLHLLDPDFYRVYAEEAAQLIDVLHEPENTMGGNTYLYEKAKALLVKQRT